MSLVKMPPSIADQLVNAAEIAAALPAREELLSASRAVMAAITTRASIDEARVLVVAILDGFGRAAPEAAACYVAAITDCVANDDFDDELDFGSRPNMSAQVIALAGRRLWRVSKFSPTPCEVLMACREVHVNLGRLHGLIERAIEMRERVDTRLARMELDDEVEDAWFIKGGTNDDDADHSRIDQSCGERAVESRARGGRAHLECVGKGNRKVRVRGAGRSREG